MSNSEKREGEMGEEGAALKKERDFAERVVAAAQAIIVVLDCEGRILSLNPYMESMCGYQLEEVQGKDWLTTFIPGRNRDRVSWLFEQSDDTGKREGASAIVVKEGSERRVEWRNCPLWDPEGKETGLLALGYDTTEREWKEEHRRLLSSMVEQSTDGMAIVDFPGNILFINRAFAAMHGYKVLELVGEPISTFHTPEQMAVAESANREVQEKGEFTGEIWHVRRDGSVFPALAHNSLLRDESGSAVGVILTARDITERKEAEELALRNTMLSAQLELSPDGVLVVDEQGEMVSFNQHFVSMWGISEEIVKSRSDQRALQSVLDRLVDPDTFLSRVEYLYNHREEKSHEEIDLLDGRVFERHSSPMFGGSGEYYGRVWYFRDISERKRTEEALRDSEEKYRKLVETANDAIFVADVETGAILEVNKRAEELLGMYRQEILGMHFTEVFAEEEVQRARKLFAAHVGTGTIITGEILVRDKNGRKIPVDISASVTELEGRKVSQAIFRDLTALR